METESLTKLAASGNVKDVEEQWIAVLESDEATPQAVEEFLPVLEVMAASGRAPEAAALAWTTVELLQEKLSGPDLLRAAGSVLLQFSDNDELRQQVTELYRQTYADREGIESLLAEAGVGGGRPVRRALRTLEVCLAVNPGDHVVARHDDTSARVETIDEENWNITVLSGGAERRLGPVEFADRYLPADADDYRVLRDFDPPRLAELIEEDPASVVISILRANGDAIDSDALKELLCPSPLEPRQWGRWWTKARTALKRSPHVDIEGRAPYYLKYRTEALSVEQETLDRFVKLADARDQLAAVEDYLRDCKAHQRNPDAELLDSLVKELDRRAKRLEKRRHPAAFETRLVQRRVERELGRGDAEAAAVKLLASAGDPLAPILALDVVALWPAACDCLAQALPGRHVELMAALLPVAPLPGCKELAIKLGQAGFGKEQFDTLVQDILSDPIRCASGLLWLWDGAPGADLDLGPPVTLLTRVLSLLAQIKRDDTVPRESAKQIALDARRVLGARRCERFRACQADLDSGMAATVRTQLSRLDNLGRAVREDLGRILRERFPEPLNVPKAPPWADDTVLWTTSSGLTRKRQEIDELVNVKMRENAKRIGEAAAHGDLSENSEYKFALEERDLLRSRLAQMQEGIARAEPIVAEDVPTSHVGVGSKVIIRHVDSGTTAEMIFLGPWDADLDRHIYNYQAPLCQAVMGSAVGDTVELANAEPPGRYEIVTIENSLA